MWSEVFTHDFDNGEKVAILLIDTQGIFDSRSTLKDSTTIFSLSMLLASIQCYNIMQNIQENDLHYLELFMEYGRMALQQTNTKAFQKLVFIIRDWQFAYENSYGWQPNLIKEMLTGDVQQTAEMQELRTRIGSNFERIEAFSMPHPGFIVARSENFTGSLKEIDPEFIKYVKELVPALLAPENLIVKKVGGEKIRARDLPLYLEAYIKNFNSKIVPQPKSVFLVC